jgi:hypothetical protein
VEREKEQNRPDFDFSQGSGDRGTREMDDRIVGNCAVPHLSADVQRQDVAFWRNSYEGLFSLYLVRLSELM